MNESAPQASVEIEWWNLSTEQLSKLAGNARRGLQEKAVAGDADAARVLWNIACNSANDLAYLVQKDGTPMRALLEKCDHWPVDLPAKRKAQKQLADDLIQKGFGRKCSINALGKYDADAPTTHAALKICQHLVRVRTTKQAGLLILMNGEVTDCQQDEWREWVRVNAGSIPPCLTRENAREWADLSEPLLSLFWGQDFVDHPDFSTYKKGRENATRGTLEGELLKLWRQSWNSIANP